MSKGASFFQLFAGFVLMLTGGRALCPIKLSPPRVVVKYGDTVKINCSTLPSQALGMGWESTKGGTGLKMVNHLTWTVERLTDWAISPRCYMQPSTNSSLKQCSVQPKIVVYKFPETISISSTAGSAGMMTEMEEYNLTCEIQNVAPVQNLTVRWYKGDRIFYTHTFDNPSKYPMNKSPTVSFKPTRQDNGVTFKCEARLDLGPEGPQLSATSQEYIIGVEFGPDIRCAELIQEWETLEKYCEVTGNPVPAVKWLKGEQPINRTMPLSRENAGTYVIKAEGAFVTKKDIHVRISYEPELVCPSNYTALEHAPHNLTCIVQGYPEPGIVWYKDGEHVTLPENLTRWDAGQYFIKASNILATVSSTVDITVLYPPSPIVELEDTEVDIGSPTWLKCSSTGNPRPKYSWNYYQTDNVMEENDDGVSRLLIHNATVANMGFYTCHAWNDRGNVSKTAKVTVKGATQVCPIEITPDSMVIQYQSKGRNATCKPTLSGAINKEGKIYWESLQGTKSESDNWSVDTYKDWDPRPVCTATFKGIGTCQKPLNFTLYKTPDTVTIRRVDNSSMVLEKREFQLQCDITNVAPARSLAVQWYRGNETVELLGKESIRLTGCLHRNTADCDISGIRSPVNVSSTITLILDRRDNEAAFRCEAQLDLGPEGPQPPPNMMSDSLEIAVYYKPTINTTKLPKVIPVFKGYPEQLVCEADGHPPPEIRWHHSRDKVSGATLIASEAGIYNCSATNELGSISYVVEVILKGKPVSSSCSAEVNPPSPVVKFGDPVSANCTALSDQVHGMGWESTVGGVPLTLGVTSLTLNIPSVTNWGLRAFCFFNLNNGSQCKSILHVTIYKMPDSVLVSQLSQTGPLIEGHTYPLQCDVVNVAPARNLSVHWRKGNEIIFMETFNDTMVHPVRKSSFFNLMAHRKDEGTQIWCEAKLNLWPAPDLPSVKSRSQDITVLYPPTFSSPADEKIELKYDSKIILNCLASGNPMPVYSWQVVDPIQLKANNQTTDQPILTPYIQLPGIYTCTASNSQGSRTKHFTVVEAARDHTILAAVVGVFASLGVLLFLGGLYFVTPDGTFAFNKGSYQRGQPASSGPV